MELPTIVDDPKLYKDKVLFSKDIFDWVRLYKCEWLYNGEPDADKPHAKLTSETHSSGYYNLKRLFNLNPRLCAIFAGQLVKKIEALNLIGKFDVVAGSSYSAITLSYEVAEILGVSHIFTEKHPDNLKEQICNDSLPEGSRILQIEETIVTLGTAWKVRRAIQRRNQSVEFLPDIFTVLHRPPKLSANYGTQRVISLVEKEIWAGGKQECLYCKAGSLPYSPKYHWEKFMGSD